MRCAVNPDAYEYERVRTLAAEETRRLHVDSRESSRWHKPCRAILFR